MWNVPMSTLISRRPDLDSHTYSIRTHVRRAWPTHLTTSSQVHDNDDDDTRRMFRIKSSHMHCNGANNDNTTHSHTQAAACSHVAPAHQTTCRRRRARRLASSAACRRFGRIHRPRASSSAFCSAVCERIAGAHRAGARATEQRHNIDCLCLDRHGT